MTEEILVSSKIFDTVKQKFTDGYNPDNHRSPRNEGTNNVNSMYRMYRHIDMSNKIECSTSKIMERYIDKDIDSILTEQQRIDYWKLIEQAKLVRKKYTHIFNSLNIEKIKKSEERNMSQTTTQYNYLAKLSTDISHIHKIPMVMARKLFLSHKQFNNSDISIQRGHQIGMNNKENDARFTITYLGDAGNYQSTTSDNIQVNNALSKADSLVDQYNSQMQTKRQYDKMILSAEQLAKQKEKENGVVDKKTVNRFR